MKCAHMRKSDQLLILQLHIQKLVSPKDYIAALNMDDLRNNFYLDALVFGLIQKVSIPILKIIISN